MGSDEALFAVEEVNPGRHASGFGRTGDGRSFAFRVRRDTLYLQIYRQDVLTPVPDNSEIEAVAEHSVAGVDLSDERSIVGVVRDAVAQAQHLSGASQRETTAVRAFFQRVGAVFEGL